MSKILITGPARCGKSEWAEKLAQATEKPLIYVATALTNEEDQEWQDRITQHRLRRSTQWQTLEIPYKLTVSLTQIDPNACVLVDSLGTWVANHLDRNEKEWAIMVTELLTTLPQIRSTIIFVAEETGWGVIPAYPLGRSFRDRLGNLVRRLSIQTDEFYLVVGGYLLDVKQWGKPLDS